MSGNDILETKDTDEVYSWTFRYERVHETHHH
jgi:hypothetical protein